MHSRKKEVASSGQSRKGKQSSLQNKPIHKVLKDYNSCYHQRITSRKDIPSGKTNYTISINMKEYPKTLQAYNNRDFLAKNHYFQEFSQEKPLEIRENFTGKSKKVRCEGPCGKLYLKSYLKLFMGQGLGRYMCSQCVEENLFRVG
jgi:hypothetical protein